MAEKIHKVLLVEDNPGDIRLVQEILAEVDTALFDVALEYTDRLSKALVLLSKGGIDLVLLDLSLPDNHGISTFEKVYSQSPDVPIVILSGMADKRLAIGAVKKGAQDYLVKGQVNGSLLIHSIHYAIERRRVEQSLYDSEHKYRSLVQLLPDIIYTVDPEGRFTFLNDAVRTLGYEPEKLIGKHFSEILNIEDANKADSSKVLQEYSGKDTPADKQPKLFDERRTGDRKTERLEIRIRTRDEKDEVSGEIKCIEDEAGFIEVTSTGHYSKEVNKVEKQFLGTIGVIKDITDRKKMEEALLQSEKLKFMGTIASGISHEFNNILAVISGKVQLLEMDHINNKELTDELRIIKRATDDGAEIVSRILASTKTKGDTKESISYSPEDLIKQAINFTMPRWKNIAQAKEINYVIETDGINKVPSILCNPSELREVFINIINNALDAMPDGGNLSFNTWSRRDIVYISITDTGEGMPEKVKKNIFDPFFTTKRPAGTGLGMSVTYGIIKKHGGKIEVESEVGKGTTFTLKFSACVKTTSPMVISEQEQGIMARDLRILVVDDEKYLCMILDKFFSKKEGYEIKTVESGLEAIELTKKQDFDLVLCDLVMPDAFGYDVIKALNKLEKRPKIGIITGWDEKIKFIEEEGLSVDFVIQKPFNFSELTRQINYAISAG